MKLLRQVDFEANKIKIRDISKASERGAIFEFRKLKVFRYLAELLRKVILRQTILKSTIKFLKA